MHTVGYAHSSGAFRAEIVQMLLEPLGMPTLWNVN